MVLYSAPHPAGRAATIDAVKSEEDLSRSGSFNKYGDAGEGFVDNWFRQNASIVAQERGAAWECFEKAAAARDGKACSAAFGNYVEKLFFSIQPDLALQVRNDDAYIAALIAATAVIRREVSSLYVEMAGESLSEQWMQLFESRMKALQAEFAPRWEELIHTELGLVVSPDQVLEITHGGPGQGIRVLPKPKRRGRRPVFTSVLLKQTQDMKLAGKSKREIAKVLYATPNPTEQQRGNVATILRYHFARNQESTEG